MLSVQQVLRKYSVTACIHKVYTRDLNLSHFLAGFKLSGKDKVNTTAKAAS